MFLITPHFISESDTSHFILSEVEHTTTTHISFQQGREESMLYKGESTTYEPL